MNTATTHCFHRIIKTWPNGSKTLAIIHKVLLVISVYLVFGLLFQYVYANADETIDPYQSQHGSVWLLPENGTYIEALQMHTDVDYEVVTSIARAKVTQRFINSSSLWAEGIYVFPLPEKAAVDHFRLIIGDRIIEGQVKERVAAKKTYERARSEGKKASLMEQQRPNVFTTSLANIAPGEEITIEFEYQQVLEYRDNSYRLRFPMVVGPRYHTDIPSLKNLIDPSDEKNSVYTETDPVSNEHNPTRIHILLDTGVSLSDLKSSYHPININQSSDSRYVISTIGENITSDRDFELVWKPQLSDDPQLSAFSEEIENSEDDINRYTMVTLLPPDLGHLQQKVQARDVIFVIDISGSMAGTSIQQAKASLITAIDGLSSIDRFNIIWFNNESARLYPKAITASSQYKTYAKRFIRNLEAGGGTEMIPAMTMALEQQESFSRFRQVVFITDGNINNETELFKLIDKQLGDSRLFTIGIGSAPNAHFMRQAAQQGRGTFTYIGDINEVEEKTITLFKKLETPALINIHLQIDDMEIDEEEYEMFPRKIPDLYAGETATIFIKNKQTPGSITLSGDYGNSEWRTSVPLKATSTKGLRVAWAREKISSLMGQHRQSVDAETSDLIKQKVVDTALQHHLVSRYTSLLAVDVTPENASGMLHRERMKNNLPDGWKQPVSVNNIMLAQAATDSYLNLLLAAIFFIAAAFLYRWNNHRDHSYA